MVTIKAKIVISVLHLLFVSHRLQHTEAAAIPTHLPDPGTGVGRLLAGHRGGAGAESLALLAASGAKDRSSTARPLTTIQTPGWSRSCSSRRTTGSPVWS